MKLLDKTALVIFSMIVLMLSVILGLLIFGWVDIQIVDYALDSIINNEVISKVVLGICTVFILLALKCIFFDSDTEKTKMDKQGVLLESQNGKLLITKDTLINVTNNVIKAYESVKDVITKVELDVENNVAINVTLFVSSEVIIKELSSNIQLKVKEEIKRTTDLNVKEVNIKIKNIYAKKAIIDGE